MLCGFAYTLYIWVGWVAFVGLFVCRFGLFAWLSLWFVFGLDLFG